MLRRNSLGAQRKSMKDARKAEHTQSAGRRKCRNGVENRAFVLHRKRGHACWGTGDGMERPSELAREPEAAPAPGLAAAAAEEEPTSESLPDGVPATSSASDIGIGSGRVCSSAGGVIGWRCGEVPEA